MTFVGEQCGKAKEALGFYTSIFPDSEIRSLTYYSKEEGGGTPELIKYGVFTLNGKEYGIAESSYNHAWSFSPAVSFLIQYQSEDLISHLYKQFSSNGGLIMVPLDEYETGDYGFGKKFGWYEDKYGVSWQFVLIDE